MDGQALRHLLQVPLQAGNALADQEEDDQPARAGPKEREREIKGREGKGGKN